MAMTKENWTKNINSVNAWMNVHADNADGDMQEAIQTMRFFIGLGDKTTATDKNRSAYWGSIRTAGESYEDFPASQKGRGNNFSEEVNAGVTSADVYLTSVYASFTVEQREFLMETNRPHGKTGGHWADWEHYTTYNKGRDMRLVVSQVKNKQWDGLTFRESGMPDLMPNPVKNTQSVEEADEEE